MWRRGGRVLLLFLLGVLGLPTPANGQVPPQAASLDSVAARFEAANRAYERSQYDRAVDAYQWILAHGYESGALYYNLGNAYVRQNELGPAIRYYEKARRLRPQDPRVQHSLEQARRRAGVYADALPPQGITGLVQGWSPLVPFVGGLLLMGGGLLLAVAWTSPGQAPSWGRPSVWGPVAAGSMIAIAALSLSYVQSLDRRAVVIDERVSLRGAPDSTAPSDTTLVEGILLEVQERRPSWTRIRLGDGTSGWVASRALGDV